MLKNDYKEIKTQPGNHYTSTVIQAAIGSIGGFLWKFSVAGLYSGE